MLILKSFFLLFLLKNTFIGGKKENICLRADLNLRNFWKKNQVQINSFCNFPMSMEGQRPGLKSRGSKVC